MDNSLLLVIAACLFVFLFNSKNTDQEVPQADEPEKVSNCLPPSARSKSDAAAFVAKHTTSVTLERSIDCGNLGYHTLGLHEGIDYPLFWAGSHWLVPDVPHKGYVTSANHPVIPFRASTFPAYCRIGTSVFLIGVKGCSVSSVCITPDIPDRFCIPL